MSTSLGRRALDCVAAPIRSAPRINRAVMRSLMADVHGPLLELGPGSVPLLRGRGDVAPGDKYAIELAGEMRACRDLGYNCLTQDIGTETWRLPDESVGLVVSNQVLEHVPRTDHVLRESLRVLRPGGRFLVSVPNPGALVYVAMLLMTLNPPMSMVSDEYYGLGNPFSRRRFQRSSEADQEGHGHLRLFTVRGMTDLLSVHGFRVVRTHGATWGVPLVGRLLARLFPWYGLCTIVLAEKPQRG